MLCRANDPSFPGTLAILCLPLSKELCDRLEKHSFSISLLNQVNVKEFKENAN